MKVININQVVRAAQSASTKEKNHFTAYRSYYKKNTVNVKDFMIRLTYFIVKDIIKNPNSETIRDDVRRELLRFIGDSTRKREVIVRFMLEKSKKHFGKKAFKIRNSIDNFLGLKLYIIEDQEKKGYLKEIKLGKNTLWERTQSQKVIVPESAHGQLSLL